MVDIPAGETMVLDTSVVIAYLDLGEAASPAAVHVVDELVGTERNPGVISAVTLAEVLVGPVKQWGRAPAHTVAFLLDFPGLSWRSVDFLVAAEAAHIRALTALTLADALIAATATVTSSPWLITNDALMARELDKLDWPTRVVMLSELVVD